MAALSGKEVTQPRSFAHTVFSSDPVNKFLDPLNSILSDLITWSLS